MSDDMSKREPQGAKRINVNEDYETEYWTRILGVSEEKPWERVKRVGVMPADVQEALDKE